MKILYVTVSYDMGLGQNYQTVVGLPLPVRELLFTGTRFIVLWYAIFVYWYTSYCLLVRELLFTGTRVIIYWYANYCLLVRELRFTGKRAIVTGTRTIFTCTGTVVYW